MTTGDLAARGAGAVGLSRRRAVPGAFWLGPWPVILLTVAAAGLRFGYSSAALAALAGTVSVPVMFDAVRRAAGTPAALGAAAVLALMPESLLAARGPVAGGVLLCVFGLWMIVAGAGTSRARSGAAVRAATATALRPSPALQPSPALRTGTALRTVAGAGLLAAGAAVVLTRPGAAAGSGASGLSALFGATRMHYGSVFGGLVIGAVAVAVVALAAARPWRRVGQDSWRHAGLALGALTWLLAGLIAFLATGSSDGRYLEAAAPALAIGLGSGAALLAGFGAAGQPRRRPSTAAVALALAAVSAYAFHFDRTSTSWGSFALLEAAVGAALLATTPGRPRAAGRWLVVVLVLACTLAVPVHETLALVRAGSTATSGIAGIAPPRSAPAAGAAGAGGGGAPVSSPLVSARVSGVSIGPTMPRGFLGFSFEYPALLSYAGDDPAAINPVLLGLMRGLNPAGAGVLRIGGDSTDHTWWPTPGLTRPGGVNYDLTPKWTAVARGLADRLGAKLILGVNLAADDPPLAAAEARALVDGVGRHDLEALEIGNEADVYNRFPWYRASDGKVYFARPRSYDLTQFIADFNRWRSVMPAAPLAGPTFARPGWMAGLGTFLQAEPGLALVTYHRYPTRGCESNSSDAAYASIPNLMSRAASTGLADQVAPFVAAAHADGLRFRLDELNSASCAGRTGVSNTFASSLWVLDTLFNLAAVGVDGVNIHTLPGAAYAPFDFAHSGGRWTASVRPLYYGLLTFARAFPAGSRLLSVQSSGDVTVWATRTPAGHLHVVLINQNPHQGFAVRLVLPGPATPLVSEALRAPSLGATGGVTLDGESFGTVTATGTLPSNPRPARVSPVLGSYLVTVPSASALMLTR